ncbi:MAG: hypothetical protein ACXAD7_26790 [Candidatus Kariarchaeaceae archaeon]|jgi:hypothetical protein
MIVTTYIGVQVLAALSGYLLKKSASRAGRDATNSLYKKITRKNENLIKNNASEEDFRNLLEKVEQLELDVNLIQEQLPELNSIHADRDFFNLLDQIESILQSHEDDITVEIPHQYLMLLEKVTDHDKIHETLEKELQTAQAYLHAMINTLQERMELIELDNDISRNHISHNILKFAEYEARLAEEKLRLNFEETYELAKHRILYLQEMLPQFLRIPSSLLKEVRNIESILLPLGLELILIVEQVFEKQVQLFLKTTSDAEIIEIIRNKNPSEIGFVLSNELNAIN